jgi:phage terminase large subunit-like protein
LARDRTEEIREIAESDLVAFIKLVAPKRLLGSIHEEVCGWWTRQEASKHQLLLMPRDHMKSALVAYRVAWWLTKNPDGRVLYLSATSGLAEKQLKFIKDIMTSSVYSRYWPEMINEREGDRERWTQTEVSLDHPRRKEEGVRDPSIFTAGLTTNKTGLHFDIVVFDDCVVAENAYTLDGREKVEAQYSLIVSIEAADTEEWVVGTRYHPKDLYGVMQGMEYDTYDLSGNTTGSEKIFEVFERQVEDMGDGTGQFLWPRQQRPDGRWFGFDREILARKRGQYIDRGQFRAQYYNDPNDPGEGRIDRGKFQYYEPEKLSYQNGAWHFGSERLNVFAAVDFAFSLGKRSDYTAIVVIGVSRGMDIYVLELDRFKTDKISEYFQHILQLHNKWDFHKISAEVTSGQQAIVKELKDSYIKPYGLSLSVAETKPTKHQGSKEERMDAILKPKYENDSIWHYRGGNCQTLEEELVLKHPAHDDCMDALSNAISIAVAPSGMGSQRSGSLVYNSKFGGISF